MFHSLGSRIEINETGTTLRFHPGLLIGGTIKHDCGLSRSIGWFVEGIIPLAPFCKYPLQLSLTGITNDEYDFSVDTLRNVTLPLLQNFGIYNSNIKIVRRGVPPKGGGQIEIKFPIVRTNLQSVYLIDEGYIKRIRGLAFCTKISPTILSRVVDSCRSVLNNFIPDVYIHSDHYKGGKEGGNSPGYSINLIAETTTGVLLSIERTAKVRREQNIPGLVEVESTSSDQKHDSPEDIGIEGAHMLLDEIYSGNFITYIFLIIHF